MGSLSDFIEQYLRQMLSAAGADSIEIQRRELARIFRCSPSQINYVLETRFTPEHGFMIDSRRGGGGFIRIRRIPYCGSGWRQLDEIIGVRLNSRDAEVLLNRLQTEGIIEQRFVPLIQVVLMRELGRICADEDIELLRARVLRTVLGVLTGLDQV